MRGNYFPQSCDGEIISISSKKLLHLLVEVAWSKWLPVPVEEHFGVITIILISEDLWTQILHVQPDDISCVDNLKEVRVQSRR
jgi:hypothetical protein